MPTYFIDLDGTVFKHGTNEFLPGAVEWLESLKGNIVWCTRRGYEFPEDSVYGPAALDEAMEKLESLNLKVIGCVLGCGSPRILVNDEDASVILHETNTPWVIE